MLRIKLIFFSALLSAIDTSDVTDGSLAGQTRIKRLALHPSQWSTHLWPDGVVPYEIAAHYNGWERGIILSAMAEFPKHTCISFRPRNAGDRYYLSINKYYNLERCFSYIGRQTTFIFRTPEGNVETRMRLDPSCLRFNGRGTVMHELMHIIGFYHEHQRDDRDPRVAGSATHYNYKIYPRWSTYYMGKYDPTSIMHYNFPGIVYPRSYFSVSDILRINTLYRCPQRTSAVSLPSTATSATNIRDTTQPSRGTQQVTDWMARTTTIFVPKWPTRRAYGTTTAVVTIPTTAWTTRRNQQFNTTNAPVWMWTTPITTPAPFWTTSPRTSRSPVSTTTWAPHWVRITTKPTSTASQNYLKFSSTTITWTPHWPSRVMTRPARITNRTGSANKAFQGATASTTLGKETWTSVLPQTNTGQHTTRMPKEDDEQLANNEISRMFRL
ncbi:hypothetical protein GCK32_005646 [Trichostrongylus colubriformis]|uniref:Metalloendopeptidase n=1 Tax=Trichostrongylus colubriformis TaxID=6319 RepID=A0AAN8ITD0_TRICO